MPITPRANIPLVELPAAAPSEDALLEDVADPLASQAYVYLFLVAVNPVFVAPRANIPLVLFPAAAPK